MIAWFTCTLGFAVLVTAWAIVQFGIAIAIVIAVIVFGSALAAVALLVAWVTGRKAHG